jgi:hypothetical protein
MNLMDYMKMMMNLKYGKNRVEGISISDCFQRWIMSYWIGMETNET